jgi:hypothetical protein
LRLERIERGMRRKAIACFSPFYCVLLITWADISARKADEILKVCGTMQVLIRYTPAATTVKSTAALVHHAVDFLKWGIVDVGGVPRSRLLLNFR